MAGLVPAIHVFIAPRKEDVDARHKAGHDDRETGTKQHLPHTASHRRTGSVAPSIVASKTGDPSTA